MPVPRTLVHSAWFDFACARLGGAEAVDAMLGRELYRLSLYADFVPVVPANAPLRIYRTTPFLRDDGQLVRLWSTLRCGRTTPSSCSTSKRSTRTCRVPEAEGFLREPLTTRASAN
jgi:hypothetical protein